MMQGVRKVLEDKLKTKAMELLDLWNCWIRSTKI